MGSTGQAVGLGGSAKKARIRTTPHLGTPRMKVPSVQTRHPAQLPSSTGVPTSTAPVRPCSLRQGRHAKRFRPLSRSSPPAAAMGECVPRPPTQSRQVTSSPPSQRRHCPCSLLCWTSFSSGVRAQPISGIPPHVTQWGKPRIEFVPSPPHVHPPPRDDGFPPPRGNRHQVTVPWGGGGGRTPLPISQF